MFYKADERIPDTMNFSIPDTMDFSTPSLDDDVLAHYGRQIIRTFHEREKLRIALGGRPIPVGTSLNFPHPQDSQVRVLTAGR